MQIILKIHNIDTSKHIIAWIKSNMLFNIQKDFIELNDTTIVKIIRKKFKDIAEYPNSMFLNSLHVCIKSPTEKIFYKTIQN